MTPQGETMSFMTGTKMGYPSDTVSPDGSDIPSVDHRISRNAENDKASGGNVRDKKTDTWLMSLRVQFPSDQPVYGSMGNVTYAGGNIKIQGRNIFGSRTCTFSRSADLPSRNVKKL